MVDAYIQVHKKSQRLEECLSSFRKFYPESSILLVSDNGDDLTETAERYNCNYIYSSKRTGLHNNGFNKEQNLEWIDRISKGFKLGKNPYLIYLEDDVLIRGEIQIDESVSICGTDVNPIDYRIIEYMESKYNVRFNTNRYGTSGGALYKKETFLRIYDKIVSMITYDLPEIEKIFGGSLGYLDLYMPVFYMACGIEYHTNRQLVETHRNRNWNITQHPIVHGKEWLGYFS